MILSIIYGLVLAIIFFIVFKEIVAYEGLNYYRMQGAKTFYNTYVGIIHYFIKPPNSHDQMERMRKMLSENTKEDLLVFNYHRDFGVLLIPNSPALIKEFFSRELEISKKKKVSLSLNFGFFDRSGQEAMEKRGLFADFFHQENIKQMSPTIFGIIHKHIVGIKGKYWSEGDDLTQPKSVPMRKVLDNIFAEIVDRMIMGEDKECFFIEGQPLSVVVVDWMNRLLASNRSLSSIFTYSRGTAMGLNKLGRESNALYKKIEQACDEAYKKRLREGPRKTLNMMDLLVNANKDLSEEEKWSKYEIAGHIILFQLAGADTSKETTCTTIYNLAQNKSLQDSLRSIANSIAADPSNVTMSTFDNDPVLNYTMTEIMRIWGSAPMTTLREISKPCKLGKYKLRKGDSLLILLGLRHLESGAFESPHEFIQTRFKDSKVGDKMDYTPFSYGRRACIGQYLALLMIKMIITELVRYYELSPDPTIQANMLQTLTYGIDTPTINLRNIV